MGKKYMDICVSLILMLAFSLGMMCQYHHHDMHGNVYIGLSAVDDLALGDVDSDHSHCTHHHCDHGGMPDGNRRCSLHIDQCPLSLIDFEKIQVQVKTLQNNLFLSADRVIPDVCPMLLYVDYSWLVSGDTGDSIDLTVSALRAPPVA